MKEITDLKNNYPALKEWWKTLSDEEVQKIAGHPDPDREFHELALFTQIWAYRVWREVHKK